MDKEKLIKELGRINVIKTDRSGGSRETLLGLIGLEEKTLETLATYILKLLAERDAEIEKAIEIIESCTCTGLCNSYHNGKCSCAKSLVIAALSPTQ